jgi:putative membrane protein
MKILAIIKRDFYTNTRDRIKLLSLGVAILLPLAYGFLYLWAFWNPYDNMKNVPVAIVNEDAGTLYKNKQENYGDTITAQLEENKVLAWKVVDRSEAECGLSDQRYYAVILIPQDFSVDLTSAENDSPRQASIRWQTMDSTNFIFTTYFKNVIAALQTKMDATILPEFSTEASAKVDELTVKLDAASSGAKNLTAGLSQLKDGSHTLSLNLDKASEGSEKLITGLGTLDSKSAELNSAAAKGTEGAAKLSTGLTSVDTGAESLSSGLGELKSGASKLKDGSAQAVTGTRALASGAQQLSDKVDAANSALSPFYPYLNDFSNKIDKTNSKYSLNIPNYISEAAQQKDALVSGTSQLSSGSETLAEKMVTLDEGVGTLQSGIGSAKSGADTLQNGLGQLAQGSNDLHDGLGQFSSGLQQYTGGVSSAYYGAQELGSGLGQLTDGSKQLESRLGSAEDGAATLTDELAKGSDQLGEELAPDKVGSLIRLINEPIVMANDSTNANATYGTGFAPYFIPLALWMGALILTLLVPTRDPRLIVSGISRLEMTIGKFFLLALIGICQAFALSLAVIYGLGMQAAHPRALVLFCILIALTSIAIMQLLSYAFGKVGELLGIVLLMIQLTSASGTFPVATAPRFFQLCSPFVPMTYAIRGLRLFILGGDMAIAFRQALTLGAFLLLFLTIKTLITKKTVSAVNIYPLIEL